MVSDLLRFAVVVTSRKSYTGSSSGSRLFNPAGICTDVMSHILLCDARTKTMQMLSEGGECLKYLLTDQSSGIDYFVPFGLSYDFYTHCLWVGSRRWAGDNMLSVYRHINRHPAILGKSELSHTHLLQKNL